jgi:hypothetical protein
LKIDNRQELSDKDRADNYGFGTTMNTPNSGKVLTGVKPAAPILNITPLDFMGIEITGAAALKEPEYTTTLGFSPKYTLYPCPDLNPTPLKLTLTLLARLQL